MVEREEEVKVCRPKGFSETKFANYLRQVYGRFRTIFQPLIVTLEEVKQEYTSSRDGGLSEKAQKADHVMSKIYNATFLLGLSSLVDIYTVYGHISEILQIVDIMPFDRKDKYDKKLEEFVNMLEDLDFDKCACSIFFDYTGGKYCEDDEAREMAAEVCTWRTFHGDIRELKERGTYRRVVVGCLVEDGSKTRAGREVNKAAQLLDLDKVIRTVTKRARGVTTFLMNGLSKVYTEKDVTLIENMRRLLDLKSLSKTIQLHGAPNVASTKWRSFRDAAVFIEPDLFARLSADELRLQFRDFVGKLSGLGRLEEDNTVTFARFLDPGLGLYRCKMKFFPLAYFRASIK